MILYAPADTYKRPLINAKKRKTYKIFSIIISFIYVIIIFTFEDKIISDYLFMGLLAATMMIHRSATRNEGNTNDFSQTATTLSKIDQTICSVYQAKTGKSRDEILDLMDKETWLTPKDAVDQGFADEILSVNNKAPQMVDSIGSIPLKNKVDQFMKFVVDQTNKNEEKSTINNSHDNQNHESYFDSALFKSKLKAIKGEKDGNKGNY